MKAEREEPRNVHNRYVVMLIKEDISTVGQVPNVTSLACLLASSVPAALQQAEVQGGRESWSRLEVVGDHHDFPLFTNATPKNFNDY